MRGEHTVGERTTWVKGDRENLDDASRKILAAGGQGQESSGTSIFDPVLCEICYRWFCTSQGAILDPFAGGSVRGIVAQFLGYNYTGIDLSARQIEANRAQAADILPNQPPPTWINGDSSQLATLLKPDYMADLVFSCPPYGDLEVYSTDKQDLSTMAHADFIKSYRAIIAAAVARLKPNRFAVFVIGDFRDEKGFYRNFVSDTISAFQDAGAALYNEIILVTAVGSLPIRAGKQFESGRKSGKTHQNVLVFCKGEQPQIELGGKLHKFLILEKAKAPKLGKTHEQVLVFFKGDPKAIRAEFPTVEVELPPHESALAEIQAQDEP